MPSGRLVGAAAAGADAAEDDDEDRGDDELAELEAMSNIPK